MSTAAETLDQEDLSRTQTERWDLLTKVKNNEIDPKVASAATKVLDGIDKQILTRKRIQVDSKVADSSTDLAREMIRTLRKEARGEDFKRVDNPTTDTVDSFKIPDDLAPGQEVVPGATSVGVCDERYDEFQDRMEKGTPYTEKEST